MALLALLETIAIAVHLQDVDMVGEAIEEGAGQPLGAEHTGPLVEREIAGDDGGAALIALAEHFEQQLGGGPGTAANGWRAGAEWCPYQKLDSARNDSPKAESCRI